MMKQNWKRNILLIILPVFLLMALFSLYANHAVENSYDSCIYKDLRNVPQKQVALLLGTSKYVYHQPNLYYLTRLKAAAELYRAGKVHKILASGDNSTATYDEPGDMKGDLVKLGIRPDDVYLDYAGFRTLDSIARARQIFGLQEFIIVSQEFHCRRAVFIARSKGIAAIAYCAGEVNHPGRFWLRSREWMARVKTGIDLWILNKSPKFLGEKVRIS